MKQIIDIDNERDTTSIQDDDYFEGQAGAGGPGSSFRMSWAAMRTRLAELVAVDVPSVITRAFINAALDAPQDFTPQAAQWTGFTSTVPTCTLRYRLTANVVTLFLTGSGSATGTSNSGTFTLVAGALPAAIRPTIQRRAYAPLINAGTTILGQVTVGTDGSVVFNDLALDASSLVAPGALFTASGTKGLGAGFVIVYPLS